MKTRVPIAPFLVLAGLLAAPAVSQADPPAGKEYALFLGTDLLVNYKGKVYPVRNVVGSNFVVRVDDTDVKIPTSWASVPLQVDPELKLSRSDVLVDHLDLQRAFVAQEDPMRGIAEYQGVLSDQQRLTTVNSAQRDAYSEMDTRPIDMQFPILRSFQGRIAQIDQQAGQAQTLINTMTPVLNAAPSDTAREWSREKYTALDITFELTTARPIHNPYVVVLAQYHDPARKKSRVYDWVYAEELAPLRAETRRVAIHQSGFPPGFVVDSCKVHLYDGPNELGTNLAERRVPLSRGEAFTYLLLDYLHRHKTETLPARPAIGRLTPDEAARLNPGQMAQTYYVAINAQGLPTGTFVDRDGTVPADANVAALVAEMRFYPALESGQPAAGRAELHLRQLPL